jgi:hypothetical protein
MLNINSQYLLRFSHTMNLPKIKASVKNELHTAA